MARLGRPGRRRQSGDETLTVSGIVVLDGVFQHNDQALTVIGIVNQAGISQHTPRP